MYLSFLDIKKRGIKPPYYLLNNPTIMFIVITIKKPINGLMVFKPKFDKIGLTTTDSSHPKPYDRPRHNTTAPTNTPINTVMFFIAPPPIRIDLQLLQSLCLQM